MNNKTSYIPPLARLLHIESDNFLALSGEEEDQQKLNQTEEFNTSDGIWD